MPKAADNAVWRHRTPRGTYLGDAEGKPHALGRLRHLAAEISQHRHALSVFTSSRFRATYRAQASRAFCGRSPTRRSS